MLAQRTSTPKALLRQNHHKHWAGSTTHPVSPAGLSHGCDVDAPIKFTTRENHNSSKAFHGLPLTDLKLTTDMVKRKQKGIKPNITNERHGRISNNN